MPWKELDAMDSTGELRAGVSSPINFENPHIREWRPNAFCLYRVRARV